MFISVAGKAHIIAISNGPDPSTSIDITWIKPDGGAAIDNYTLQWTALITNITNYTVVPHIKEQEFYNYIQTRLTSGEIYQVVVFTQNQAGSSITNEKSTHETSKNVD